MWREGEGKRGYGPDDPLLEPIRSPGAYLSAKWAPGDVNPDPIRQDCGTSDVRSSGAAATSCEDERGSPLRSNSIRRSKALERRNG